MNRPVLVEPRSTPVRGGGSRRIRRQSRPRARHPIPNKKSAFVSSFLSVSLDSHKESREASQMGFMPHRMRSCSHVVNCTTAYGPKRSHCAAKPRKRPSGPCCATMEARQPRMPE